MKERKKKRKKKNTKNLEKYNAFFGGDLISKKIYIPLVRFEAPYDPHVQQVRVLHPRP